LGVNANGGLTAKTLNAGFLRIEGQAPMLDVQDEQLTLGGVKGNSYAQQAITTGTFNANGEPLRG
jgi:hypothetical protein